MTETEIRKRLRKAFGEPEYPPGLRARVRSRLDEAPASEHSGLIALVAALLAIAIVGGLMYIRVQSRTAYAPSSTPRPTATVPIATPSSTETPMNPLQQVPIADIAGVGLASAVGSVADPNLTLTNNGRTVRLIGAYADPARIVLIFRTLPLAATDLISVSDDLGPVNASSELGGSSVGDTVFILNGGPHAGSDGIAHLRVTVPFLEQGRPAHPNEIQGPWMFAFPLKVQPATALAPQSQLATVGSWKVSFETFELTPSVIHLRLLVTGASAQPEAVGVQLVTDDGSTVQPQGGVTRMQGDSVEVEAAWIRPYMAVSYQLKIDGGGGHYAVSFSIPAPAVPTPDPNLSPKPPGPNDLPAANEWLTLKGAMDGMIYFGNPWQCMVSRDPSGAGFILEMYFRWQGVWYLLGLVTDPADRPYSGPGTYGSRAYISPIATNGPADHIFTGTVELTVTSGTAPFGGTMNGGLHWDDDPAAQVSISGDWSCQPLASA